MKFSTLLESWAERGIFISYTTRLTAHAKLMKLPMF